MVTVALVGADGSGKTSVGQQILAHPPAPLKYVYMGVNPDAATHSLPTTRFFYWLKRRLGKATHMGGPPDPTRNSAPKSLPKRILKSTKSLLLLSHRISEEWYRQCVVWCYEARGFIVLFDRHFFCDYYAHDIAPANRRTGGNEPEDRRSLAQRLHGSILRRFYPRPDLLILLDAPAEVLFARKQEGSVALIEARRQEYQALASEVSEFRIVDARQPLSAVTAEVAQLIAKMESRST